MLFDSKVRVTMDKTMHAVVNRYLLIVISCIVSVYCIAFVYSHERSLKVVFFGLTDVILKIVYKIE
ncbi:hypothetical protein GCM10016272_24530 [Psychrobacter glaciei]|uniref:Uncharacterized protein n=1 Tax=Psychrobacter glaciei TaxID=619771 RepID=A0ABQ3GUZ5_9GAMM|nr:hypothetical protein GCM10016272_24530 [Psychrobacter glaciei]